MQLTLKYILTKHLPLRSYSVLNKVIHSFKFSFKVTGHRVSKLGDFRVRHGSDPVITVNGSLNQYSFLITFLHELAHLAVYNESNKRIKPHGYEWKTKFQEYLLLSIKEELFPKDLLEEILLFTNNPKASTCASPRLMKALAYHDDQSEKRDVVYLEDIELGNFFVFRNQRYRKIEKRRTRVLCERLTDGMRYTISAHAEVTN